MIYSQGVYGGVDVTPVSTPHGVDEGVRELDI